MLPHTGDANAALATVPGDGTDHPRWVLAATIAASSLAFIDGSVVNVALPAIGRSISASTADLQWTINAYLLPLSALLLLGGAAGDHFGRRRLLIIGTTVFAGASLGCVFAPNSTWLLTYRAIQGVGAALLMPNSLAVLGNAFAGEARGRAIGTWASIGAIASAIGPPLGGWLVVAAGWRAIFLLNLPVAAAAVVLTARFVRESGEGEQSLDWAGAVLATLSLGLLTWALTLWSSQRAFGMSSIVGATLGSVLLIAFLVHEHRCVERAMMPLGLFSSKAFVGLTVTTLLLYGALGGLLLLLPFLLISGGAYSPFHAGVALLPLPVGIGLASRIMGRVTERVGPRWPLTIGPIVTGAGFVLLVRIDPAGSYWAGVFPGIAVIALGMACAVAPLTTAVLSSVDDRHTGTASGLNSAIARSGGLIATALSGGVISQTGAGLLAAFHVAALLLGALAAASGVVAYMTLGSRNTASDDGSSR